MRLAPSLPAALTQTYTYDGANGLKTAQESGSWSRVYDYDAYGNRWVESANHTLTFATPTASSQFNAANNRISQNFNGQGTPPAYDAAGNLTSHLHIGAMAYDAENHQTSFTGASGTATYQYDGDGRRVKKLQGTRTTVFVYDAFGNLAAEYDTQPAPNLMAGAYYRTTDHLGSTRLVTNATGGVVSRRDFFPFGEQIDDTWGNRQLVKDGNTFTTYNREFGVHQKFTGKERDDESGLGYFGARYFSASLGRFAGPDVPLLDQSPTNPQSWNLYGYMRNNPLKFRDPNGQFCWFGVIGSDCDTTQDQARQQEPTQQESGTTATVAGRKAKIPLGGALHAVGIGHQWIETSDGRAMGMGAAREGGVVPDRGEGSPQDLPGDPTQVAEHSEDVATEREVFQGVDPEALNSYLVKGQSTGPWLPGVNDCNTWCATVIRNSTPHTRIEFRGEHDYIVRRNVVVYADGSVHQSKVKKPK